MLPLEVIVKWELDLSFLEHELLIRDLQELKEIRSLRVLRLTESWLALRALI